ncbi:glucose 1-dehydrogenase [Mesorhizobium sp.]|uniref:SDR family NAD(P)-dependent oxidoreductase n=1 Tax=Mesorhizobium sp. TaxID=1871066 RepID=UPI00120E86CD|nr:glucose 1-dehydrogenase [Mesorhizobium sp.]TIO08938.1 MAG: glucose 1-dehydrogenase [Mesorhizobium sp.]TIO30680.1 MAG: glucose 1-dehydrogenase [Mesorhizobium sp.]TIP12488.1 MAG: glucose 1-dehydrogenase [Mesorhizobium sp.]
MSNSKAFEGKVVLVVGGSRGIGAAVSRRFAGLGAAVAIGHRTAGAADALVAEIAAGGGQAKSFAGDTSKPGEAEAIVRGAYEAFGRLDVLVNTAGIGPYLPLARIDEAHYRSIFDTNVLGTILLTQAAAPLLPSPGGRIVHFASRLAYSPIPTSSVYSASKAAVITLVHGFARELGPKGITVNAVAPGVIETDMTTTIIAERGEQIRAMTPLGRIGQPEDIAGIVTFLASDDAGWITGRTILADGGVN